MAWSCLNPDCSVFSSIYLEVYRIQPGCVGHCDECVVTGNVCVCIGMAWVQRLVTASKSIIACHGIRKALYHQHATGVVCVNWPYRTVTLCCIVKCCLWRGMDRACSNYLMAAQARIFLKIKVLATLYHCYCSAFTDCLQNVSFTLCEPYGHIKDYASNYDIVILNVFSFMHRANNLIHYINLSGREIIECVIIGH